MFPLQPGRLGQSWRRAVKTQVASWLWGFPFGSAVVLCQTAIRCIVMEHSKEHPLYNALCTASHIWGAFPRCRGAEHCESSLQDVLVQLPSSSLHLPAWWRTLAQPSSFCFLMSQGGFLGANDGKVFLFLFLSAAQPSIFGFGLHRAGDDSAGYVRGCRHSFLKYSPAEQN